jgi:hypothetical protein
VVRVGSGPMVCVYGVSVRGGRIWDVFGYCDRCVRSAVCIMPGSPGDVRILCRASMERTRTS